MSRCFRCNVKLTKKNWYPSCKKNNQYICKTCQRADSKEHSTLRRHENKRLVIEHYSHGTMACLRCGFSDMRALTIDHINGGGLKHFKSLGISSGTPFYEWLIKNNYPEGFQVLCFNCQWLKRAEQGEVAKV